MSVFPVRILTTSTSTHLLARQSQPQSGRLVATTSCGKVFDYWTASPISPAVGTHEGGDLAAGLCKSCKRTADFTAAVEQHWRYENRHRIAEAEAYVATRFYPALPKSYGVLAVKAVDLVNSGDPYALLDVTDLPILPTGTAPGERSGYYVTAARMVQVLRLSHMIEDEAADLAYLD